MKVCFQVTFPTPFRNPLSEKCDSVIRKGVNYIFFVSMVVLELALKTESPTFKGRLTSPLAIGLVVCADKSVKK